MKGREMTIQPLTDQQAAIISAYTGVLVSRSFGDVVAYVDEKLGESTMTHEYASDAFFERIKGAVHDDFLALVPVEDVNE